MGKRFTPYRLQPKNNNILIKIEWCLKFIVYLIFINKITISG